jgi:hypothetical protein
LADGSLAQFFWRVVDRLDYWLTQAVLWSVEAAGAPEPQGDIYRQQFQGTDLAGIFS